MKKTPYFEMTNITKLFARVVANRNVDLEIHRGEVLALLGENGAGKSTLMKILYGLYKSDEGEILKDGETVKIQSPKDAMNLGISMIQQHFSLIPAHTVLDNIILGTVHGRINYTDCEEKVQKIVDKFDMDIYDAIDILNCVRRRSLPGGPAPEAVAAQIEAMRAGLE